VNGDIIIMGFDCNKYALRYLKEGKWNYDGQCSPFQAAAIDEMIKKLEAGETIEGGIIYNEEKGFDAKTITDEDIEKYGLGD
jgi:simple sugar transport system substrate-binding protein